MNKKVLVLVFLIAISSFLAKTVVVAAADPVEYWAVLVCGDSIGEGDAAYAYHVLNDHYNFSDIYYLHVDTSQPGVDAYANTTNFRWAITNWLASNSDANDIVFIYIVTHGNGMHIPPEGDIIETEWWSNYIFSGYYDANEDEMYNGYYETREQQLGEDINGDGYVSGWVGVDELCVFPDGFLVDDELADDLNTLDGNYGTLVFVTQQCMGGGLIDDLSAPNRIIITAIDETHLARADEDGDGFSEWTQRFFDALHGIGTHYSNGEIIHESLIVDADYNSDGTISMWEAFKYAQSYNSTWWEGKEYPQTSWLDDDGNRLPTFVNNNDIGEVIDEGFLAYDTWLSPPTGPGLPHDVAISDVSLGKTVVGQDYSMNVSVTVTNEGKFTEVFDVTLFANSSVIGEMQVTLVYRESKTLTFTWNTAGFVYGYYVISATAERVVGEYDVADNTLIDGNVLVTIPGDVDGDRDVDIFDIVMICGAYGTKQGDPGYIANCDIDDDGDVDIFDLVIAQGNYGQSW